MGKARMDHLYRRRITWHSDRCRHRHGVVLNVCERDRKEIQNMLVYFFGEKCYFELKNPDGTYSFEFVPMTNWQHGLPRRPWGWCNATVLFKQWKEDEDAAAEAMKKFTLGDNVMFEMGRSQIRGTIQQFNKKTVSVHVQKNDMIYYIPAKMLYRV